MKKTLIALVALSGLAMADYTWTGGNVTAADSVSAWKDAANWDAGTTISGNGPMTSASGMWQTVIIDNGSDIVLSSDVSIEGWDPHITLSGNSSLTIGKMVKMQNDSGAEHVSTFIVGEGSSLFIQNMTQSADNRYKGAAEFVVDGILDINFAGAYSQAAATSITLGDVAAVTLRNIDFPSATVISVTADLGRSTSADITLLSRDLMTLDNVTLGTMQYNMGEGWTQSTSPLTATAENVGKFYVVQEGTTLKAYYVMPEPATATLSLLALAGLAARRRRH